jgi:hypothetical protein
MKLSPKLAHTIMLSKVDLRWNEQKRAWYSVGKLGLAGVGKTPLNALIDGHVEIRRENATDVVEIYLEPEPQTWYYLKYANNLLLAKSQSENFDAEIGGKAKGDYNTATSYGACLGDFADVDNFRSHFQKDYLGKSGKLAARPAAPAPGNFDSYEGKKKKKGKGDDAFGTDSTDPATAGAAPEPTKKKKKAKANDPFGDGVIEDAAAAAPAPAKKEKTKEKAADEPATADAPADAPEPQKVKTKTKEADDAPATEPAADQGPSKKELDRQAKEAEKLKKEEEKKKKEEEKRKKKNPDDPFGDS